MTEAYSILNTKTVLFTPACFDVINGFIINLNGYMIVMSFECDSLGTGYSITTNFLYLVCVNKRYLIGACQVCEIYQNIHLHTCPHTQIPTF